ncbi:hypothetical protein [Nocardia veterana]|uniref:Uncharacterized protein n=1 Tax=Nocardia veterana TaxID=132249 RepID=A0A7X6RKQ2_9NOCA|nr:hypothetical protein [Nocardia veterana]NKY88879.1 hypothetical protein [Nocardia veterana]
MTSEIEAEFRPDLSPDHLRRFVRQIQAGMPRSLWQLIEPWSRTPRLWVGDAEGGKAYGLDLPAHSDEAVCELHAPIRWHEVVRGSHDIHLLHPSPTAEQLGEMWDRLVTLGLQPAMRAHLGPWRDRWVRDGFAPAPGAWAVDVIGISAIGAIDKATADELANLIDGRTEYVTSFADWAYWSTT